MEREARKHKYYSAEILINGLGTPYQFRIWNDFSAPMSLVVRQDSKIVPWLKPGEVVNVKYYSCETACRPECLETAILNITKSEEGRFRGHYLVGLEIVHGDGAMDGHVTGHPEEPWACAQ